MSLKRAGVYFPPPAHNINCIPRMYGPLVYSNSHCSARCNPGRTHIPLQRTNYHKDRQRGSGYLDVTWAVGDV
jgi:hypothetical protein